MPGKVNPVIQEVINQICFRVFGADTTITSASEARQLQLNAREPVIIWSIYDSCTSLINGMYTFVENCLNGIEVDEWNTSFLLNRSTARVTERGPFIGYAAAAQIAKHIRKARREC